MFLVLCIGLSWVASTARGAEVRNVRFWTSPGSTRIVLDMSAPAEYRFRRLGHPERIVIDLPGTYFTSAGAIDVDDGAVRRIRRTMLDDGARLTVDLAAELDARHFVVPAGDDRPDRLVIDVFVRPPASESHPAREARADSVRWTIVLDPGHGGLDSGAVRRGVREKDVTLDLAGQLAGRLNAHDGIEAVLTREGDYFMSLSERVHYAARAGGDLFVSIHANVHDDAATSGMEVYVLTEETAGDRHAQALADKENAADYVGAAPGERRHDTAADRTERHEALMRSGSNRLARHLVATARRRGPVPGREVRQAGFHVLRNLDMPGVLVETAYLSHGEDRNLLSSRAGRGRLAETLCEGILDYLRDGEAVSEPAPEGWTTRYRVRAGDTLWRLSRRHGTTVAEIRERNGLTSNALAVGQVLRLP